MEAEPVNLISLRGTATFLLALVGTQACAGDSDGHAAGGNPPAAQCEIQKPPEGSYIGPIAIHGFGDGRAHLTDYGTSKVHVLRFIDGRVSIESVIDLRQFGAFLPMHAIQLPGGTLFVATSREFLWIDGDTTVSRRLLRETPPQMRLAERATVTPKGSILYGARAIGNSRMGGVRPTYLSASDSVIEMRHVFEELPAVVTNRYPEPRMTPEIAALDEFRPLLLYAWADADRLWVAHSNEWRVHEISTAGDTIAHISVPRSGSFSLSEEEERWLTSAFSSLGLRLRDTRYGVQPLQAIYRGDGSRMIVQVRSADRSPGSTLHVFSREGALLSSVMSAVPIDPASTPLLVGDILYAAARVGDRLELVCINTLTH